MLDFLRLRIETFKFQTARSKSLLATVESAHEVASPFFTVVVVIHIVPIRDASGRRDIVRMLGLRILRLT